MDNIKAEVVSNGQACELGLAGMEWFFFIAAHVVL